MTNTKDSSSVELILNKIDECDEAIETLTNTLEERKERNRIECKMVDFSIPEMMFLKEKHIAFRNGLWQALLLLKFEGVIDPADIIPQPKEIHDYVNELKRMDELSKQYKDSLTENA